MQYQGFCTYSKVNTSVFVTQFREMFICLKKKKQETKGREKKNQVMFYLFLFPILEKYDTLKVYQKHDLITY